MTADRPGWAVRLRAERTKRLWSQKETAVRLRNAADDQTRARLPELASIQRYVRDYEAGKHHPGDLYMALYCRIFGLSSFALFADESSGPLLGHHPTKEDAANLTAWIESTNSSDDAIAQLAEQTRRLAEAHTQLPPAQVLADVIRLHRQTQQLLQGGRQRLRQARELFRIEADLLAHACMLIGDLDEKDRAANAYGRVAALCAEESGATKALALSARAKTLRWQRQYAESADLAVAGYACSPATPVRVLLASQEASAAALLGDARRAYAALARADSAADSSLASDSGRSAWSCAPPRQAMYHLVVNLRLGNPQTALRAAEMADAAWADGDPWLYGTWAQIRIGAGIAHLMTGSVDGAAEQVGAVLAMAPQYRIATVIRHLAEMDARLRQRRFRDHAGAVSLREQIRSFTSGALPGGAPALGGM